MKSLLKKFTSMIILTVFLSIFAILPVSAKSEEKTYLKMNNNGEIYENISDKDNKEIPIETKIKYYLDGKEIAIDEIKGKSGKVKIEICFTNKDKKMVNIDGKQVEMYTPYLVASGMIIDDKKFTNITVSSGKVIDNGTDTIIVGIALPGMKESLGTEAKNLDIPSNIVIEADCTNFELGNMYMFVESNVFDSSSFDFLDEFESMFKDIQKLKDASTQLVDGSKKLKDGSEELKDGVVLLSSTLKEKINEFRDVENEIRNKEEIEAKIYEAVDNELNKLMPDLQEEATAEAENVVDNHKEELENATFETAMKYSNIAVNAKLNELKQNGGNILSEEDKQRLINAIANDVTLAIQDIEQNEQVIAIENVIKQTIQVSVKNAVSEASTNIINTQINQMKQAGLEQTLTPTEITALGAQEQEIIMAMVPTYMVNGMTQEQAVEAAKAKVDALVGNVSNVTISKVEDKVNDISNQTVDTVMENLDGLLQNDEALNAQITNLKTAIAQNIAQALQVQDEATIMQIENNIKNTVVNNVKERIANDEVIKGYGAELKSELNSSIDEISVNTARDLAGQYTETLTNEIIKNVMRKSMSGDLVNSELADAINEYEELIYGKLNEVDSSIYVLEDALDRLEAGTIELSDGAAEIADGMEKFDQEGIDKIYNLINGDVKSTKDRVQKLMDLSKEDTKYKYVVKVDSLK